VANQCTINFCWNLITGTVKLLQYIQYIWYTAGASACHIKPSIIIQLLENWWFKQYITGYYKQLLSNSSFFMTKNIQKKVVTLQHRYDTNVIFHDCGKRISLSLSEQATLYTAHLPPLQAQEAIFYMVLAIELAKPKYANKTALWKQWLSFHQRRSVTPKLRQIHFTSPRTPLGSSQRSPDPLVGWEGRGLWGGGPIPHPSTPLAPRLWSSPVNCAFGTSSLV